MGRLLIATLALVFSVASSAQEQTVAMLDQEIENKTAIINELNAQIHTAELESSVGIGAIVRLVLPAGLATGLSLTSKSMWLRTFVYGVAVVSFTDYYVRLNVSWDKLPELKLRLKEEEGYIRILTMRRGRLLNNLP